MSDFLETLLVVIAVFVVFVFGVATGYSCGTKDMDEVIAAKSVTQYKKLEADLKGAVTQRDECRRIMHDRQDPAAR